VVPVVSLVLAAAVLHEPLPSGALIGAALVVVGGTLVSRPRVS